METPLHIAFFTFFCAVSLPAQQPPLIDRELFFGDPEIAGAQISPDGKYIAFIKPWNKTMNIWVKGTQEPFEAAKPVTAQTKRPIFGYFWSRDSRYLLYVQDNDGDENYNVWAVNPAEAPAEGAAAPLARNITDVKGVRAMIYSVPKKQPDIIYVGLNDRDKAWHDLYKVKPSSGERILVRKNTERITGWVFDHDAQLRLATRSADNGDTEILRVDTEKMTKIYSCDVLETCGPVRFNKDNKRLYLTTNKGAGDLSRLALLDPASGQEVPVESDPMTKVDFGSALFSEVTEEIISTSYTDERTRFYWKNKSFEADYQWLRQKLSNKEIRFGSRTQDEQLILVNAFSDTEPGETHLFDRKKKKLILQYRIFEKLPRESLAPVKTVRYTSSDGLEIPAYLTLPKGVASKNLPAVISPHGGPWARDVWRYNPIAQFLANRGYAVLSPNFRGSTGYGKKFLDAGNGQWGDKMQDDITWGVKYLVAQGVADPKRVGIMGGSYGGYATLGGVAFTPDLYAAAVSIVGPSNLITLLDSIPPYWEMIRKMFHVRMGDPSNAEDRARLERQSPLNSALKIKTPLMVIQGANDPRVKKAESEQIVIALRDRGFAVEYLLVPDEGHGFAKPVNNLATFTAAEKFFAKHLKGTYQEEVSKEIAGRLKEITVDPKSVVLSRKVDPASVGAPKPAAGLRPGKLTYQANLQMGTQSISMKMETTVKEEEDSWVITETAKMPMGEAVDTARLTKDALTLVKRTLKQGPATIEIELKDNKVTGTMNVGGPSRNISAEAGGPLFADSPGGALAIASLPLAEGYTTQFRNFDLMKQKPKLMTLKVTGSEAVTVPAGAFEAYKVEISSSEGGPERMTLWVAKEGRRPVKLNVLMPEMNGATMTAELTSAETR